MSGKHFLILKKYTLYSGSPTHTREVLRDVSSGSVIMRITHAYAGSTPPFIPPMLFFSDHPRIRGKYQADP